MRKTNGRGHRPVLRLLLAAALIVATITACQLILGPPEADEEQDVAYLELLVGDPTAPAPRLIEVTEYEVTSLLIQVTGPDGEVIQTILWTPPQGSQRYRIPVKLLGEHEVSVAHRSRTEAGNVEAVESETFQIAPMIITEVRIVPGAVGYIIIDAEQRAADLRAREVLPQILEQAEAAQYVVTRMATQLPAGTTIFEDAPPEDQVSEPLVLEEASHLYFVDLQPGAYYEHPVRYLAVGKSGETKVVEAQWWPRVNDVVPDPFVRVSPKLTSILDRNVVVELPSARVIDWVINPGIIQLLVKEAFICVQGLRPSESLYTDAVTTYQNGYNFFDAYRSGLSRMVGLTDYDADDVLSEIDTLVADGYDIITIYIIAHGGNDYVRLGGVAVTASQFATKMASYPSVQFNFLLGSCHSGSFQNNLQAVTNIRVVETACTAAESAWPDKDNLGGTLDTNSLDTGSEWTSSLLEAAQVLASDATLWTTIVNRANTYNVPRTSVLLNEAGYLGTGANRGLPTPLINYDLTYVVGWSTPQHYNSWEIIP
jgi:hypothetical protein